MKVAKKVVFLLDGGDGLCSVIYGGLHPNPSSNFQTRSDSFELSLERYGIEDRRASGEILHHVNANGFLEVIYDAGEHIANVMWLSFSREMIMLNPTKISRDSEEAWRALYG